MSASNQKPILVIISGPTAVGKTKLSVALAESYHSPIISADSRQIYKEMPIGTAQPDASALARVPHSFVGSHSIHDEFTAGDFEREGLRILENHFQTNPIAFLVGGTLFYIRALIEGLDEFPSISKETRAGVQADLNEKGLKHLQKELQQTDLKTYKKIDLQNSRRLCRAIMVIRESGRAFSSFKNQKSVSRPFTPIYIQLDRPRAELYDRINRRVDQMIDSGLQAEARALYPYRHLKACDTVGYKEWFQHFDGEWSREKTIEKIKQHTRNYAKRQLTWFRKEADQWHRFSTDQEEDIRAFLKDKIGQG
ncbi:MAG: tRNA (adenosine(37)-N6)-dimethylallyltransferase MiaA [Bacteroidetes bacterium]|nr:tRNA (adenosine(37)-N6)-dimethylallyltransferase MiaA [Bacteroidota bacterium]